MRIDSIIVAHCLGKFAKQISKITNWDHVIPYCAHSALSRDVSKVEVTQIKLPSITKDKKLTFIDVDKHVYKHIHYGYVYIFVLP